MTLIELMVYMAMLFLVMGLVYQARLLFVEGVYKETNQSGLILDSSLALDRLRLEVSQSRLPVRIASAAQPSGAPAGTGSGNCIEMNRLIAGATSDAIASGTPMDYSIYMRWDGDAKGFRLHYKRRSRCPSDISAAALLSTCSQDECAFSGPIFLAHGDNVTFFSGVGEAESGAFREVNFNYTSAFGKGRIAAGVGNSSIRLSTSLVTPQECRVASADASWFTDFGAKKLRTVIVSFTLNFDAAGDRLRLLGSHSNVSATSFDDLGILHLYAKDGKTVEEWLKLLSDVEYFRAAGASAVSQDSPPRRITFSLGEGLPYNVAGLPSGHFYLAVKLDSATNFAGSDDLAKRFCYPSFQDDSNYLGRDAKGASSSCKDGNHPRLTGHLVTLTTEGEDDFFRRKVLKMVYPFALQTSGAFVSADVNPSSGTLWLGGEYKHGNRTYDGVSGTFPGAYRWIRGFELWRQSPDNKNEFARSDLVRLAGVAAGKYWESIDTSLSGNAAPPTGDRSLFYSISPGSNSKYWGVSTSSSTRSHFAVEFGDNKNSTGGINTDEDVLNANIRLKRDITVTPYEFFRACRKN